MERAAVCVFDVIAIGAEFSFERTISVDDVAAFVRLSGDANPLHTDVVFAAASPFGRIVVHGMLVASLFSRLIGMKCPGRDALYLAQTLEFRKPVFVGDAITIRGTVTGKRDAVHMVTLRMEALRGSDVVVCGTATVQMLIPPP